VPRAQRNSIAQSGHNPVGIEDGRIVNVDMANFTADVKTKTSQRQLIDIQWASPYMHFTKGEGINFMPEVGSQCKVCMPSDSTPFILCFTTTFERERQADGQDPQTTLHPESTEPSESPAEVTFRSGRPKMQQGDIHLSTRDGNSVWLHRGGVVEIGATGICKRFYIPLLNTIRDVCENYNLISLAGEMSWLVQRDDRNASGDAEATFTLASRNFAQDEFASVFLQMGHVDDTKRFRMVVAPNIINPRTGEVSGESVYSMEIDEDGNLDIEIKKKATIHVEDELDVTVDGDVSLSYGANLNETVGGDQDTQISGNHTMQAVRSTERLSADKTIDAARIKLGGSAMYPVLIMSPATISFLLGHTHPVTGAATGPPVATTTPQMMTARKTVAE